jgi:hypothetical protein
MPRFPGPNPLPLAQVMDLPASKALRTGPYQSEVVLYTHRSPFWGPKYISTRLTTRNHFTGPNKVSISRAQPSPLALVMDMPASKALVRTGPQES